MVGRSARARRAMATARAGSAPGSRAWSASKRASSRSTSTPLAWLSRSITRTSRYCSPARGCRRGRRGRRRAGPRWPAGAGWPRPAPAAGPRRPGPRGRPRPWPGRPRPARSHQSVQGPLVGGLGRGQASRPQVQVADQRLDIGPVGGRVAAGGGRLDHGRDRPGGVAEQLAGVGDPGQAALGRLAVDHRLGGDDGRLVAAQLDLGVEDDPEGVGQVGVGLGRPGAPGERGLEVVAAQLEQAAGDHGVGVAGARRVARSSTPEALA